MLVVQVDDVDAESLQRRLTGGTHIVRTAVDAAGRGARLAHDPKLGGKHDRIAPALQRLAHGDFVGVRAVHVGRIQESHAERERTLNQRDSLRLRDSAARVEIGQAHAAQSEFGDLQTLPAQCTRLHRLLLEFCR